MRTSRSFSRTIPTTDDQVWQYFNNLPPASLNNNLTLSGGNQFFANYTGVLSQLVSNALTNFQSVLGSYYPLWQRYLASVSPLTTARMVANVTADTSPINASPPTNRDRWITAMLAPPCNPPLAEKNSARPYRNAIAP